MIKKAGITINSKEAEKLLSELTLKDQGKIIRSALRKAGKILENRTEEVYGSSDLNIKGGKLSKINSRKDPWVLDNTATTQVKSKGYSVRVHIMKDFRVKFFEGGTRIRYRGGKQIKSQLRQMRKSDSEASIYRKMMQYSTGVIKPRNYFKAVINSDAKKALLSLEKNIIAMVEKIKRKYNA